MPHSISNGNDVGTGACRSASGDLNLLEQQTALNAQRAEDGEHKLEAEIGIRVGGKLGTARGREVLGFLKNLIN
jgi:hypothetical protein